MVDFNNFESKDDSPIYTQIIDFVKREIVAKRISDGDTMPSRRFLSSLLGVNPNTIQKSYKILEEEGIINSKAGTKSLISINEEKIDRIKEEMIEGTLVETIKDLKHMGLSKNRSLALIEKYWMKEGDRNE